MKNTLYFLIVVLALSACQNSEGKKVSAEELNEFRAAARDTMPAKRDTVDAPPLIDSYYWASIKSSLDAAYPGMFPADEITYYLETQKEVVRCIARGWYRIEDDGSYTLFLAADSGEAPMASPVTVPAISFTEKGDCKGKVVIRHTTVFAANGSMSMKGTICAGNKLANYDVK